MSSSSTTNQRIGPTSNSYNTAARDNTIISGNKTTVNSNNTTNSHTYQDSNVHIGDTTNNNFFSKPRAQKCEALEKLVESVDWDILLPHLSVADQDKHRSMIPPLDRNEPKFFWITRNIDFTQWESEENSQVLWLSGPHNRGMKEVSSHIIEAAKEKAIQPNSSVLYFFCSTATMTRGSIATVFAHTLLRQIVCSSSADKAKSIAVTFLRSLLGEHIRRWRLSRFKENDTLSTSVKTILGVPDNELHFAIVESIRIAEIQELSIIIDGVDITSPDGEVFVQNVYFLVKDMMVTHPKFNVVLTSIQSTDFQNTLGRLPCTSIEYDKERKECLRFLQHDDTRYGNIVKEHHGSLKWLWNHPQYRKWSASTTSSLLYIEGKPGSGKSTLTKYFEKNLAKKMPIVRSCTMAHYFYTFRGTQLEATHNNMLRSILFSILQQDESAFLHFQFEFRKFKHRNNSSEWPYDSLKTVLSSFANHPPTRPLYLIIDAMDESQEEDRRSIIQLVCRLCSAENSSVKVFLASRPVAELTHQIENYHNVIRLQDENKDDIQKFINSFLPDLKLTDQYRHEAANYIKAKAEGVFVWVQLVKAELLRMHEAGHNDTQIIDRLKYLPTELVKFYELMLDRLEKEGKDLDVTDGITIFKFVLFALRPLTVLELQHILAIQHVFAIPGDPNSQFNPSHPKFKENLFNDIEKRITYCGGNFVEITADKTVQLMHQTAREFFLLIEQEKRHSRFAFNCEETHRAITIASVRYLMLCFTNPEPTIRHTISDTKTWGSEDFQKYARYMDQWPWINYTLHNLKTHRDLCDQKGTVSRLIHTLIKQLSENRWCEFLGNWMACHFGSTKSARDFVWGMASLKLLQSILSRTSDDFKYKILDAAAALKLFRVVDSLLPPCAQVYSQVRRETPLILCARKGLVDAFRVLADQNEDLNAEDITGRTALHHASKNGHEAIVRQLLNRGADKMVKDRRGLRALQLAFKTL